MRVGEEILLVEDNPDDVLLIKRALRKNGLGCEVVVARDGEEALRHLLYPGEREAPRPMPGLMLVDIHLPKVDGLEVLRRVRADGRTRDLAVVLLVSPGAERRGAVADRGGTLADLCIQKAVDFEWIVWEVGRLKVGSGAQSALGAMRMGATPDEAAQVACAIDPYCSGPITVERLG